MNIIVEEDNQFSFNSFHAYMGVWTPNVCDENLYLEPEDRNEYDKNDGIDGTAGVNVPINLSKTFKRFLTVPNCTIKYTVIGKRVNNGVLVTDSRFL